MENYNTVLFDFDGTLMDTGRVIIQSWQQTYRTLENREEEEDVIIRTFGEPLALSMEKTFPTVPVEESLKIYRDYQYGHYEEFISLFPGMEALVRELKERGYKLGIVTSRLKRTTIRGLEKYHLTDCFGTVITMEDTDKHKPDPAPVNAALEKLQARAEDAVLLGDTMYDILCAKNAGVTSVLVGWATAVTEEEKTGPDKPDYILEEANDLMGLL